MYRPLNKQFTWLLLMMLSTACVDVQGPVMDTLVESDVLSEVRIRSTAIMIAKGDSLQIGIDLIAMNGDTIPYRPENVTWTSSEAQTVRVASTGMIYGRGLSNNPIRIAVAYVHKYVTKFDTVNVYVTDGRIDANAIRLIALDSNRVGGYSPTGELPRVRVDLYKDKALVERGALIPIQVEEPVVAVLDRLGGPNAEPVYKINNNKGRIGKFWIRASLNLYGNKVDDSLSFMGLYRSTVTPTINVDLPANPPPTPILEDVPLYMNQLCGIQMILNTSTETVDILYSDSAASSTGCAVGNPDVFRGYGLPFYGQFIGGNILNMPPNSLAIRKSNTPGIIRYAIRKSTTKETVPWLIGHIKQIDVED